MGSLLFFTRILPPKLEPSPYLVALFFYYYYNFSNCNFSSGSSSLVHSRDCSYSISTSTFLLFVLILLSCLPYFFKSLSYYLAILSHVLNEILKFITVRNGLTPFSFLMMELKISSLSKDCIYLF